MDDLQFTSSILVGLYFLGLLYITYTASKQEAVSDFAIGSRGVGLWGTVASVTSGFRDGAGIVVWITLSILFGLQTMWLFFAMLVALGLLALIAKKVRTEAGERGFVTLGDLLKHHFGHRTAAISSVIIAITAFLYAASQLNIAGNIFSLFFNTSLVAGIAFVVAIVGLYLFIGGYKTVIKTDIFQWLVLMVIILVPFMLRDVSVTSMSFSGIAPTDWQLLFGIVTISILVVVSSADVWQRIFSAKTPQVAQNALVVTIPVFFLISLGLVLFGLASGVLLGGLPEGNPFFALFALENISSLVLSFIGVFVLASVMSTLDTQSFLFSQTLSRNLFKNRDERSTIRTTRIVLVVLLTALAFIASTIEDIVQFLFSAVTLGTVLAPLLLFYATGLMRSTAKTDIGTAFVLSISMAVYVIMFAIGAFENLLLTLLPALVSLVLLSLIWAFRRKDVI